MGHKRFLFVLGLCILLGTMSLTGMNVHAEESGLKRLTVPVHKVKMTPVLFTQKYVGFVQAPISVDITPNLAGFIRDVFVSGGEQVKRGQVLFTIDPASYVAAWAETDAAVRGARAERDNAATYYNRMQKTNKRAITASNLDTARAQSESARATYDQAVARQQQAEINLAYTLLSAPFAGVLGNITVAPGDYVGPGSVLAHLVRLSPVRVVFSVPFAVYDKFQDMRQNCTVSVQTTAGTVLFSGGRIAFADNQADSGTGMVPLYADFDNPIGRVLPGAAVTVVVSRQVPQAILVNKSWVVRSPDGVFVYVVHEGRITRQAVRIRSEIGEQYDVEGLEAGDLVITAPVLPAEVGQQVSGVVS